MVRRREANLSHNIHLYQNLMTIIIIEIFNRTLFCTRFVKRYDLSREEALLVAG